MCLWMATCTNFLKLHIDCTLFIVQMLALIYPPDLQVGDHVAVWPWGGCRNCHYCQRNQGICAKGAGLSAEPHKEHEYGILLDGG